MRIRGVQMEKKRVFLEKLMSSFLQFFPHLQVRVQNACVFFTHVPKFKKTFFRINKTAKECRTASDKKNKYLTFF